MEVKVTSYHYHSGFVSQSLVDEIFAHFVRLNGIQLRKCRQYLF